MTVKMKRKIPSTKGNRTLSIVKREVTTSGLFVLNLSWTGSPILRLSSIPFFKAFLNIFHQLLVITF